MKLNIDTKFEGEPTCRCKKRHKGFGKCSREHWKVSKFAL